jgi:hypothetical protein
MNSGTAQFANFPFKIIQPVKLHNLGRFWRGIIDKSFFHSHIFLYVYSWSVSSSDNLHKVLGYLISVLLKEERWNCFKSHLNGSFEAWRKTAQSWVLIPFLWLAKLSMGPVVPRRLPATLDRQVFLVKLSRKQECLWNISTPPFTFSESTLPFIALSTY